MTQTILEVRSNQLFTISPVDKKIHAQYEIIIVAAKPKYKNVKGGFERTAEVEELRFDCSAKGLQGMIAQLQLLAASINQTEQIEAAMNQVINIAFKTEQI